MNAKVTVLGMSRLLAVIPLEGQLSDFQCGDLTVDAHGFGGSRNTAEDAASAWGRGRGIHYFSHEYWGIGDAEYHLQGRTSVFADICGVPADCTDDYAVTHDLDSALNSDRPADSARR